MEDYLTFRKMITSTFIQIVYWIATGAVILAGLFSMGDSFLGGLIIIIVGPLIVRIYCELLIVVFRMNDTLTDIRNLLRDQQEKPKRDML